MRYNRGWLLLCDVMVSIGDFGSSCRGSNPLTTTNHKCLGGEMVDTRDLKSLGQKCPYEFDSRLRHKKISIFSSCGEVANAAVCKTVIRGFESHHEV